MLLSIIISTVGVLVISGIFAYKFIPKDFFEILGYNNLNMDNSVVYGVMFFVISGIIGSISVIDFKKTTVNTFLKILSVASCGIGVVFFVIVTVNDKLTNNIYVLTFFISLIFMAMSLMFLLLYSIFENARKNWRG